MKSSDVLQFGDFTLDPANRILRRDGAVVELGGRYFDALLMLTCDGGQLVTKERLLSEVWRGVPVTDEAVTQCIRTLRRALGDDAAAPRFIETVPKHGYRFIADVATGSDESLHGQPVAHLPAGTSEFPRWLLLTGSGGIGGAIAGAAIGLVYGLVLAEGAKASGAGLSLVAVVVCCGALAGLFSALAIAGGVATADRFHDIGALRWIIGGAGGGLIAGGALNMIGRDAVSLVFGRSVTDLPGGIEGAALGAIIGAALWMVARTRTAGARTWAGVLAFGGLVGCALPLVGGTLFGGSLAAVSASVPNSPFALPPFLSGANIWGMALGGAFEGALFCAGVSAGLLRVLGAPWNNSDGTPRV